MQQNKNDSSSFNTCLKRQLYLYYSWLSSLAYFLRPRLTKAGMLVLSGMVLMAARLDTNMSVGYQAFCFLFMLSLIGLILVQFVKPRFEIKRKLPKMGSAGSSFHYKVEISNLGRSVLKSATLIESLSDPRPTYQEFASIPEPGEEKRTFLDRRYMYYRWIWHVEKKRQASCEEFSIPPIAPRSSIQVNMELLPLRRGFLRLDKMSMTAPDPFGLYRRLFQRSVQESVLILPKRYNVPPLALGGKLKYQAGGGGNGLSQLENLKNLSP